MELLLEGELFRYISLVEIRRSHFCILSLDCVTRCRCILKTVKNVMDRPPVHTKTAHCLLADFENGRFSKWNSNWHILETASCEQLKMMKTEHFSRLFASKLIDYLGVSTFLWHQNLAKIIFIFKFPNVFKLFFC